ncbi:hypothetical protein U91I_02414 [alpha proteobacterium U9-1i]|nr:hypothetical protein U91I_02414 [alpha proteobacterium U9-1i]
MRLFALAALAGLSFAGVADARVWNDPAGRLTFDAPNGWATSQERGAGAADTFTYVISGNANNECHLVSQPNPGTAQASADTVRTTTLDDTRFGPEFWLQTANGMPQIFPNASAQFVSRSVDTSGFWPIQRADIQSPERVIHASLQLRPGVNLMTFCMTYGGADRVDVYTTVSASLAHPNDATWRTEAETQAAAREAAAAAPPPAPAPEAPPENNRRRNRN